MDQGAVHHQEGLRDRPPHLLPGQGGVLPERLVDHVAQAGGHDVRGGDSDFSGQVTVGKNMNVSVGGSLIGTMTFTGLSGQLCALALPVQAASKSASSERRANFIVSSLFATMLADMRHGIQPGLDQSVPIRRVRAE